MTAWEDSGHPLIPHPATPFPTHITIPSEDPGADRRPDPSRLPPGTAGIWIRTTGYPRPEQPRGAPPVIGVDGSPAVTGWGQALLAVPPGPRLVTAQLQGAGECERVVETSAGRIVELDYADSRLGGKAVIGPSGSVRGTGLTGARLLLAVAVVQAVAGGFLVYTLNTGASWLYAVAGWLLLTVLMTWLVSLPVRARGRALVKAQAGPPIAYAARDLAPGILLPAVPNPPIPALPEGYGALLLRVELDQTSIVDGEFDDARHEAWTPAPELTVDGVATAVSQGRWLYPLPDGEHEVELALPAVDGMAPKEPVRLDVAISYDRVTDYDVELRLNVEYDRAGGVVGYKPFLSAILHGRVNPPGSTRMDVTPAGGEPPSP